MPYTNESIIWIVCSVISALGLLFFIYLIFKRLDFSSNNLAEHKKEESLSPATSNQNAALKESHEKKVASRKKVKLTPAAIVQKILLTIILLVAPSIINLTILPGIFHYSLGLIPYMLLTVGCYSLIFNTWKPQYEYEQWREKPANWQGQKTENQNTDIQVQESGKNLDK